MKLLFRFFIYTLIIAGMAIGCIVFFRNHPEVQLAFLVPGMFFLVFSKIRDQIYAADISRIRYARGR
jgi:hypothetical protein